MEIGTSVRIIANSTGCPRLDQANGLTGRIIELTGEMARITEERWGDEPHVTVQLDEPSLDPYYKLARSLGMKDAGPVVLSPQDIEVIEGIETRSAIDDGVGVAA